jgi:hypothetical protein
MCTAQARSADNKGPAFDFLRTNPMLGGTPTAAKSSSAAPGVSPIDNSPVTGVNSPIRTVSRKRRGGLQISQSSGSGLSIPS